MSGHRKHAKLKLRANDNFAPNEIAILGAKCSVISDLAHRISLELSNYNLSYFDASHSEESSQNELSNFTFHHKGTANFSINTSVNKFNQRIQFSQFDYVFINGNHYRGSKQILILDKDKEASVLKRLDQLDNVQFVIKLSDDTDYFDFLENMYPEIKNLPCYGIHEVSKISFHIKSLIEEKIAQVQGLVLVGGKSMRMGADKGSLNYFGKSQQEVMVERLEKQQLKTYLSVSKEQDSLTTNQITDTFLGLGPFGAICSAFQKNPNVAWLVIATDLPFVNDDIISLLLKHRNPSKAATALKGKNKQFPEPLITIWEPKSYTLLLNYLAQGYSCPRKVLINSDVEIVEIDDDFIRNINTPEEFDAAFKELND